ncbi:MAG: hypothetical protein ACE5FU_11865, partial [Nitrospinota bacterium]
NYLKKADECFNAAQHSLQEREWNASAINAIHCCITACDAMCVYFLGKRHSGESHNDAAALFKTIKSTDEYNTNANRILRILRFPSSMAEKWEYCVYCRSCGNCAKICASLRLLHRFHNRLENP